MEKRAGFSATILTHSFAYPYIKLTTSLSTNYVLGALLPTWGYSRKQGRKDPSPLRGIILCRLEIENKHITNKKTETVISSQDIINYGEGLRDNFRFSQQWHQGWDLSHKKSLNDNIWVREPQSEDKRTNLMSLKTDESAAFLEWRKWGWGPGSIGRQGPD